MFACLFVCLLLTDFGVSHLFVCLLLTDFGVSNWLYDSAEGGWEGVIEEEATEDLRRHAVLDGSGGHGPGRTGWPHPQGVGHTPRGRPQALGSATGSGSLCAEIGEGYDTLCVL